MGRRTRMVAPSYRMLSRAMRLLASSTVRTWGGGVRGVG